MRANHLVEADDRRIAHYEQKALRREEKTQDRELQLDEQDTSYYFEDYYAPRIPSFNVVCLRCGHVFVVRHADRLFNMAYERFSRGFIDAMPVQSEDCLECHQALNNPPPGWRDEDGSCYDDDAYMDLDVSEAHLLDTSIL